MRGIAPGLAGVMLVGTMMAATPRVEAQLQSEAYALSVFGGTMSSGVDAIDDGEVYGVRLHRIVGGQSSFEIAFARSLNDVAVPGDDSILAELELLIVDATGRYYLLTSSVSPSFLAGIGWAWGSLDAVGSQDLSEFGDVEEDSFTAHAGFGLRLDLGRRFFVEPEVRWRWYEAREDDDFDLEAVLNVAFRF